ncbi:MAG: hybrid sensor histidine kinase/response regulator [Anaerolineae bacterium]|nr:hybrid sensor histidine kinase/response regulator [Anaerolineae bacterium]
MAAVEGQVLAQADDAAVLPVDRRSPPVGLHHLMQSTRRRLALLMVGAGYVWAMGVFVTRHPHQDWVSLIGPLVLAAGGCLALVPSAGSPLSALSLLFGMLGAALAEMALQSAAMAAWLGMAATLVAGVVLGPWGALPAFAALTVASVTLLSGTREAWVVIREAMAALVVVWAAGHEVLQALIRLEESEGRAWRFASEAMQRRAQVQQASKDLHGMYALLERTNRELETARREADEAREVKARFAANISHELRTPLNLILGFSRMMYRSPEVYGGVRWTPELRADVREIYQASRHLLGMIDDVLDLSRIEALRLPLRLEPTPPASVIEEAVSTARGLLRGSPVDLIADVAADLPEVVVDRTRIRQVLLNLLNNAIRFTDAGHIRVTASERDGEVYISVADTGVGIPAQDLPHIFDEFSQAAGPITSGRGGAGLGLAVCKGFVEMHGGRITVESELGVGSTFTFTIPVPGAGRARSRLAYYAPEGWRPPLPENPLGKAAVVVAPDELSGRMVARTVKGYRVLPLVGLDSLAEEVEAEHPAAVILVRHGEEDGGGITPERIWSATGRRDLGVIELEMPPVSDSRYRLQVDAFVTKPVEVDTLVEAVRNAVASPRRALVVDDDPGFRALADRTLKAAFAGLEVGLCADGEEALERLRRQRYDVILLDLAMPRLGGEELLHQARAAGLLRGARVVVATGRPGEDQGEEPPARLAYTRAMRPGSEEWSRCLSALMDAAPPDYSRPADRAAGTEGLPARLAS